MKRVIRIILAIFVCSGFIVQAQSDDEDTVSVRLVMANETGGVSALTLVENGEQVELATDFVLPITEGLFFDWSPDCNRIAFTADAPPETFESPEFGIFAYDFVSDAYSRLAPAEIPFPVAPSWSLTGETVYFMRFAQNARLSYIMDVESGDYQEFQLPENSFSNVSWAEDDNSSSLRPLTRDKIAFMWLTSKRVSPFGILFLRKRHLFFSISLAQRAMKLLL